MPSFTEWWYGMLEDFPEWRDNPDLESAALAAWEEVEGAHKATLRYCLSLESRLNEYEGDTND